MSMTVHEQAQKYAIVCEIFVKLCRQYNVHEPDVEFSLQTDPCDFTDHEHVRLNVAAAGDIDPAHHAAHVFGHYLCCRHAWADDLEDGAAECDRIADAISTMARSSIHEQPPWLLAILGILRNKPGCAFPALQIARHLYETGIYKPRPPFWYWSNTAKRWTRTKLRKMVAMGLVSPVKTKSTDVIYRLKTK